MLDLVTKTRGRRDSGSLGRALGLLQQKQLTREQRGGPPPAIPRVMSGWFGCHSTSVSVLKGVSGVAPV